MPVAVGLAVIGSAVLGLALGYTLGFLRGSAGQEDWLEHEIFERDLIIDGLSDELFLLHENPKEFRRRMETAAAVGCSFRGDFGRIVDPPVPGPGSAGPESADA